MPNQSAETGMGLLKKSTVIEVDYFHICSYLAVVSKLLLEKLKEIKMRSLSGTRSGTLQSNEGVEIRQGHNAKQLQTFK